MTVHTTQIRKIGNSLGNIIPSSVIQSLNLKEGTTVNISTAKNRIIIEPVTPKKSKFPFTEAELIADLNRSNSHADELIQPISSELAQYE